MSDLTCSGCGEYPGTEVTNIIDALEAKNAQLRSALVDAIDAWETHNKSGDGMQGYWVSDARAALKGWP